MKLASIAAVLALSVVALSGCNKSTTTTTTSAAPGVMNTQCPFSGKPVNTELTSNVGGKQVAFCCNGCKGKFDSMSADKQAELMAKAK